MWTRKRCCNAVSVYLSGSNSSSVGLTSTLAAKRSLHLARLESFICEMDLAAWNVVSTSICRPVVHSQAVSVSETMWKDSGDYDLRLLVSTSMAFYVSTSPPSRNPWSSPWGGNNAIFHQSTSSPNRNPWYSPWPGSNVLQSTTPPTQLYNVPWQSPYGPGVVNTSVDQSSFPARNPWSSPYTGISANFQASPPSRNPWQSPFGGTNANINQAPILPTQNPWTTPLYAGPNDNLYPTITDSDQNPWQNFYAGARPRVHYPSSLGATTDDDQRGTERPGATDAGAESTLVDANADVNTDAEEEKFTSVDPFSSSSHKRILPKLSWNATPATPPRPLPRPPTPASVPTPVPHTSLTIEPGTPRPPSGAGPTLHTRPASYYSPSPLGYHTDYSGYSEFTPAAPAISLPGQAFTVPPFTPPYLATPAPAAFPPGFVPNPPTPITSPPSSGFSGNVPIIIQPPSSVPPVISPTLGAPNIPSGLSPFLVPIAPSTVGAPTIPSYQNMPASFTSPGSAILNPPPDPPAQSPNILATLTSVFTSVTKTLFDERLLTFLFWLLQQLYLLILLHLPRLYHSRVSRVFRDADISKKDIYLMWSTFPTHWKEGSHGGAGRGVRVMDWGMIGNMNIGDGNHDNYGSGDGSDNGDTDGNGSNGSASGKVKVSSELLQFKVSWEKFIDDLLREWNTSNIISGLILPAILTLLQIETAGSDPVIRTPALLSFMCAIMSLLYGCISIVRFGSMRKMHKAAAWSEEARRRDTLIWWNPWVMLAMPAVWLAWSLLLFLASVMAFAWRTVSTTFDTSDSSNNASAFLLKLANLSSGSIPDISSRTFLNLASLADTDPNVITPHRFTEIFRIVISCLLGLGILYLIAMGRTFASYGDALDEIFQADANKWNRAREARERARREREEASSYRRRRSSGRSASVYSDVEGTPGSTRSRSRQSYRVSPSSRPSTAPPADTPLPSTPFVPPLNTPPETTPSPTTLNDGRATYIQYSPSHPVTPPAQYTPSSRTSSRTSRRARSRRRSRLNLSPPDSDPESDSDSFGDPRGRFAGGRTPITSQGSTRFGNSNTTVELQPNSPFRTTKIWDSTRTVPPRNLQDIPTVLRFRNGLWASWHNFFTDLIDAWSNPPDYSIPEAVLWRCVKVWNERVFELNKIRAVLCVEYPLFGSLLDPPDGLLQFTPSSRLAVYLLDVSSNTRSELAISDLKAMLLPLPPRLESMEVYISKPPGVPMPRVDAEATTVPSASTHPALNGHHDDTEQAPHNYDDNQNQPAQPDFTLTSADYPLYDTSGSLHPRTPRTTSIPTPLPPSPATSTSTPRYEAPPMEADTNPPIALLNFQGREEDDGVSRESTAQELQLSDWVLVGNDQDTISERSGALSLPSRSPNSAGSSTRRLRGADSRRVRFELDRPEFDVLTQTHTEDATVVNEKDMQLVLRVPSSLPDIGPGPSTLRSVTQPDLGPEVPVTLAAMVRRPSGSAGPSSPLTPPSILPISITPNVQPSVQPSPSLFRPARSPEDTRRRYANSFGSTNSTVHGATLPIRLVVFQNEVVYPSTPEELSSLLHNGLPGGDVRDITVGDWRDFIQRLCRLWEGDTRYLPADNSSESPSPSPSSDLSSSSSYTHSCPEDYIFDLLQLWNRSFFSMRGVQVILCQEYPKTLSDSKSENDARYAVYVLDVLFEDPVTVANSIASLFRPIPEDLHEIRLINQRPPSISRAEGRPLGTLLES